MESYVYGNLGPGEYSNAVCDSKWNIYQHFDSVEHGIISQGLRDQNLHHYKKKKKTNVNTC